MADQTEVATIAKSSILVQRLARRQSKPVGIVDVRSFQSQYAQIPGWLVQRFALLDQLQQRYSTSESTAADGSDLVFTVLGQRMPAEQTVEHWHSEPAHPSTLTASEAIATAKPTAAQPNVASNPARVSRKAIPVVFESTQQPEIEVQPSGVKQPGSESRGNRTNGTELPLQNLRSPSSSQLSEPTDPIQTQAIIPLKLPLPALGNASKPFQAKQAKIESAPPLAKSQPSGEIMNGQRYAVVKPMAQLIAAKQGLIQPMRVQSGQDRAGEDNAAYQVHSNRQAENRQAENWSEGTPHPPDTTTSLEVTNPQSEPSVQAVPAVMKAPSLILRQPTQPEAALSPTIPEAVRSAFTPTATLLTPQASFPMPITKADRPLLHKAVAVLPQQPRNASFYASSPDVSHLLPLARAHLSSIALESSMQPPRPSSEGVMQAFETPKQHLTTASEISVRLSLLPETKLIWRKQAGLSLSQYSMSMNGATPQALPLSPGLANRSANWIARQTADSAMGEMSTTSAMSTPTPSPSQPSSEVNVAQIAEQVSRILARQLVVERERRGMNLW
jgi:hypothetical protein